MNNTGKINIWTGIYIGSFFILLFLFWWLKFPAISLPYHWDELGVYAPGALYMYDHAPGLLPSALDPELSRGHPLLIYFIHACSFRIFGPSVVTGHVTALCITSLFLILFFAGIFRKMGGWQALAATAILISQPLFFAQSALILPEMLLTMCMFMAVLSFVNNKMFWYVWWCTLAVLTKETGVIIPLGVVMLQWLDYFMQRREDRVLSLRKSLIALSPWLIFVAFITVQRVQNGWFFFPYHMDLMEVGIERFITLLKAYLRFVFVLQGRWMITAILLVSVPVLLLSKEKESRYRSLYTASIVFIIGGIAYSMLIFYMSRYILMVLPFLVLLTLMVLAVLREKHWLFTLLVPMLIWGSWSQMQTDPFYVDTDMGYVKVVEQTEAAMQYTLQQLEPGEKVVANFPVFYALKDPRNGYYPDPDAASVVAGYRKDADYALLFRMQPVPDDLQDLEQATPQKVFPLFQSDIRLYALE